MTTLKDIAADLRKPFAPDLIRFKPRGTRKNEQTGQYECLAQPYAVKRAYEDRLNSLIYGEWQTPPVPPVVVGHRLIIPVTVVVCGIAFTDYSEVLLTDPPSEKPREEQPGATDAYEAYLQGFYRACAQFGLGAYLADAPKRWVPYDPARRKILLSARDRLALVEQLTAGSGQSAQASHRTVVPQPVRSATMSPRPTRFPSPDPVSPHASVPELPPSEHTPSATPHRIDEETLGWILERIGNDPEKMRNAYLTYHVTDLKQLTWEQGIHLFDYIVACEQQQDDPLPVAASA